jgi:ABC-type lipoprotein release transport system permease subunit
MVLLSVFAGAACVGCHRHLYGLMSYSVHQRTQEIGIRMALGGGRSNMLNRVLKQGMMLAGVGLVLRLTLACGATRVLGSLQFGVKASDPQTFRGVSAILAIVALLAVYIPSATGYSHRPGDCPSPRIGLRRRDSILLVSDHPAS